MKSSLSHAKDGSSYWLRAIAVAILLALFSAVFASPVSAQNFNSDARIIGMGGSDQANDASRLTEHTKPYKSIGLPLGLIQIWKHRDAFKPSDKVNFNPLLVIEDLSNPLHITIGRNSEPQGEQIVRDLVNGKISTNLNTYKGFVPKSPLSSKGVFAPDFGKTIRLFQVGKLYQGVFVGVGPYLTAGTTFSIDQQLLNAWSGATSGIPANSALHLDDVTSGQAALSVTGGYRARFATPAGIKLKNQSDRDGIYLSANYHYLRGYHYDSDNIAVRFDTDSTGNIATAIPSQPPVVVDRIWSGYGTGRALDFGTIVVTGPWDFNFGANGVANQIEWTKLVHQQFTLSYLLSGLDFVKTTLPAPGGSAIVTLPVRYSGGATFRAKKWTGRGQIARGVNGQEFHFGGEYHLGIIDLRGGGRYVKDVFNPMGGVGLNITKHFGIDAAAFSSSANAQQDHRTVLAFSLRFE